MDSWIIFLVVVVLYYVKRWLGERVRRHPERQMIDAVDRMLHGAFVVLAVWLSVTAIGNWLSHTVLWH